MKKIVLLHGWNFNNYTKYGCTDAWENRKDFVEALAHEYQIYKINLPGFCGAPEPKNAWDIDDFVTFLEENLHSLNINPDYILGYSFGAAIALKWKEKLNKKNKLILISPAIIRAYKKTTKVNIHKIKKYVPSFVLKLSIDIYLRFLKNDYYTRATKFLKGTYLNIVKIDLTEELHKIQPEELIMIFGSNDTATPPSLLKERLVNPKLLNRIKIIDGGTHDIANSHISTIMNTIKFFENED